MILLYIFPCLFFINLKFRIVCVCVCVCVQVVIKVTDEGGGIRRSNMSRIWSYLFTTANPAILESMLGSAAEVGDNQVRDFGTSSPLAGLGYGLPIARNYCRYFGGDLNIMSMEGYGTDGFIYLHRLGDKASVVIQ